VRCNEADAVGRRCRWTGRRDQLNSHRHDYDQPTASEQPHSAPAGKKRSAENHDNEPSSKTARVDASGTTQTSSVPAGTAGVELNESSSVRDDTVASVAEPRRVQTDESSSVGDTAASRPDIHQSSTDDNQDIRANYEDEQSDTDSYGDGEEEEEEEEETQA